MILASAGSQPLICTPEGAHFLCIDMLEWLFSWNRVQVVCVTPLPCCIAVSQTLSAGLKEDNRSNPWLLIQRVPFSPGPTIVCVCGREHSNQCALDVLTDRVGSDADFRPHWRLLRAKHPRLDLLDEVRFPACCAVLCCGLRSRAVPCRAVQLCSVLPSVRCIVCI